LVDQLQELHLLREDTHHGVLYIEWTSDYLAERTDELKKQVRIISLRRLLEAAIIRAEKKQLEGLRSAADLVINTTKFNVHELKSKILDIAQRSRKLVPMRINVLSFGYKYGTPHDADLIMDVRFLVNPYFTPELKDLDGETQEIRDFVLKDAETRNFLKRYQDFIDYLIPLYEKEGKAYLTIALGCTGGRHRSVTIARTIYEHIRAMGKTVDLNHRDRTQPV
jgi:UPF0042 nucleotide-binding protein